MAFIGNIEQFNSKETEISSYLERLEQLFNCNDISTDVKKVSLLIALIGGEAYGVLKDLVAPALPSEKKYVELVEELKKHYSPKRLIIAERYRFHTAHQEQHEDIRSFVAKLKNLAKFCDFSTFLDDSLRDRLVCGLKSESIKRRLLTEESLTFEKAYTAALGMELAEEQLKVMGPESLVTSSTHKTMSGGESNFQSSHCQGSQKQKSSRIHGNNIVVSYVPPKETPEFTATDGGGGDGRGAGDVCVRNVDIDYVAPEEKPEPKAFDVYYHPLEEEPEPEVDDGDGDAVDVNGYRDCDPLEGEREADFPATDSGGSDGGASDDRAPNTTVIIDDSDGDHDPPKDEPELVLVATSDAPDNDSGQKIVYDCSHCGISLSTRAFKVDHNLQCKLLVTRQELETQVTKLHYCRYCKCPFINEKHKEHHQREWCRKRLVIKSVKDAFFKCDKCEFVTKWKHHLEKHLLMHNKNNAEWFTCTQCPYKTAHKRYLTKHMRRHNNTRTTLKPAVAKHALTHNKGVGCQKYECPRCSYSTLFKKNLTLHSKKHKDPKNYQCAVCEMWFTRKQHLDSHILHSHASDVDLVKTITSKIHRCQSCSFITVETTRLKRHVRSKHI